MKGSRALCIDEHMQAHQPRSTSRALQNSAAFPISPLSFIKKKPKPLGTEFKSAARSATGVLLWLQIKEVKKRMQQLPLVRLLGANAACA
jgi:hypothetical protein